MYTKFSADSDSKDGDRVVGDSEVLHTEIQRESNSISLS